MNIYQPGLPGLDPEPTPPVQGSLGAAALATVEALERDGLLQPRHALLVQMVKTLASSIDNNLSRDGKVTVAISQATKQLLDALAALPEPLVTPTDAFESMFREWATVRQDALR